MCQLVCLGEGVCLGPLGTAVHRQRFQQGLPCVKFNHFQSLLVRLSSALSSQCLKSHRGTSITIPRPLALSSSSVNCPKCTYHQAYFMEIQTRSADEPATLFFKCVSCAHRWKEG